MKHTSCCRHLATRFAAVWFTLIMGLSPVMADVFTIDPNQSSLTISGSIQGSSFAPQGAGSLTTSYGGTIQAVQNGGTIQFTGQSLITAQTNGNWHPLVGGNSGAAPADYGAMASPLGVSTVAALRSVLFDVTNSPVAVTSGQFDASSLTFSFSTNTISTLDYNAGFFGSGTKILTGNATNNVSTLATLATVGGTQTLTFLVNAQFIFKIISSGDTIVNVAGQLVATRTTSAPLVIQPPTVTNQVVNLKWQASSGQLYQVLSSSNLQTWQTNAGNITSATTNYSWTGTNPASKGFYRLAH